MKNYTECEFKLKLPKAITEDKNAIICLDVMRKKAGIGHVVLSEAKLTDRVGNVFESQIDIMLDDNKHTIKSLKDTKIDAIIFDTIYNKDYCGKRVNNWLEFKEYIDNLEV